MSTRAIRWGLVAVLVAGAMLRFTALDYGLPRTDLGTDEQITRLRVLYGTDTERLSTPKYNWPQLNVYASRAAVWLARRFEGVMEHDPREALWIGRAYTAVLGVLTLWLVYGVGRRLFGPAVGVMSAGFLAVMPLHANRSRLWVPDVPMTAAYTLALLAAVWALQRPSWRRFALGGVAVGLAAAFKYNGAGACLPLVVAAAIVALRTGGGRAWGVAAGRLAVAGVVSLATFAACDPPVVRQLDDLVYGVTWIGEIYTSEPSTGPLGWHTISYILRSFFAGGYESVGAWTCLVAVLGLALLARRRSAAAVMAVLPGVLYLLGYSLVLRNPFERMFLPLLPHLALAAGYGAVVAVRFLARRIEHRRRRVAVAAALAVAVLAAAAPQAVAHAVAAGRGDTRLDALAWIRDNVPVGAAVLCEWDMLQPRDGLYAHTDRTYNLYKLANRPVSLTRHWDYVVASSRTYEWVLRQRSRPGFDERSALYDALFDSPRFEEVARFTPGLRRYGPELRIFRTEPPRGPRFPPATADGPAALRLEAWAWTPSRRLRSRSQPGAFRLWRPGDTVAGRAIVDEPGCYELAFSARAPREPRDLEVALGSRTATFTVAEKRTLRLAQRLEAGQVWWRLRAPGAAGKPVARVWNLRLARVTGPKGAGCSGDR